ncbi:hypothetical protein UPYG_G00348730 [Umbra pygmaea]|uniref:WWE domain-containing protein n=1 Tax=Umbra pygmaea TaxID=75934 RepID=A0ABD0VY65_UMBPY
MNVIHFTCERDALKMSISWSRRIYSEYDDDEVVNEEADMNISPIHQPPSARGSHYEWQLKDRGRWLRIDNDHVIETHYCQPGAKGINIYTSNIGQVCIDFDQIEAKKSSTAVRRLTFLIPGQSEDIGWYFKDNQAWREYGSLGQDQVSATVSSTDVEQRYNLTPQGAFQFTVGSSSYTLDFTAMTQTNLATRVQRNVRRRPKFNSILSGNGSVSLTSSTISATASALPSAGYFWEFMGEEGVWMEYQAPICSLDSAAIERHYQQNPQGQIQFKAGRHTYTLNFAGMCQTNNRFGTKRTIRRTPCGTQQMSSVVVGSQWRWQFQDIDGLWKDFKTSGRRVCSVSSQDIEAQYQQNTNGTMTFSTRSFNYQLDFSAMTQRNLSTQVTRCVRRLNQ